MSLLLTAKRAAERIPEPVGRQLARVPFSVRLGPAYSRARADIARFGALPAEARRQWVFGHVRRIVEHAHREVPFYRAWFARHGFDPRALRGFDDLRQIPVVTKADLREWTLEDRSCAQRGRLLLNTGGTSGEPLDFHVDRQAFAREWAHLLAIWAHLGYRRTDTKLTFRGKNLGSATLRYNAVHNEWVVNTAHCDPDAVARAVLALATRRRISFLHGYPSAIHEFARLCADRHPELADSLRRSLRGVLFGSEYPAPVYREPVEAVFGAPTLSWYGHSEMAILAYEESGPYRYRPMQTYGFVEAVPDGAGEARLVGTSFHNLAGPLIRYDTGDRVEPVERDGVLEEFRVASGRVGEFVTDRGGRRIPLTALVFGRHHAVFGTARFVQVHQGEPGRATLVVVLPAGVDAAGQSTPAAFDLTGLDMEFRLAVRDQPVRTAAGKVPLLVRELGEPGVPLPGRGR
jgi:phenylacetate-CoA ligase